MQKQKSITVNLVANGIKTLMTVIFPIITFPYASRVLGTVGIGKVNYATSIVSYFSLIAALGISTYAIREGARIRDDKQKFNTFAKEMLHINLGTTLISYICLVVFLNLPILSGYKKLLVILSVSIVFSTIGIEWLFIIKEEYSYITKRAVAFQFISLVLLFLLVKTKEDYYWYAALTVISSGGSALLNIWHSRKIVNWKQKCKHNYRKHLKPIMLIFGTGLASSIYTTMDTTMIGALDGDSATGIYTAAVKINTVVSTLISTISSTILPRVSYYIGNNLRGEYEKLLKSSVDILFMVSIPASIGMICTSDILILLFSGEEFISGSLAAKVLSIRVIVGAINRVLAYQICTPYKKDREVLISTVSGAIFNLIANSVLIPIWGVTGASIATLISEIVVFIVLTKYSSKIVNTQKLYKRVPIYTIISISFFAVRAVMENLINSRVWILITTVIVCMFIYFGVLFVIKDPYLEEYKKIVKKLGFRK